MHEQVRARPGRGLFQGQAELFRGLAGGLLQTDEELPDGGVFFQHAGEGLGLGHEVAAQHAHGQFGMFRGQAAHDRREAVAPGTKDIGEIEEVHGRSIRFWPGKGRPGRGAARQEGDGRRPHGEKENFLIFLLTGGPLWGNVLSCRGAVAQLGERLNGIQEVRSSILLSSTKKGNQGLRKRRPFFRFWRRNTDGKSRSSDEPRLFSYPAGGAGGEEDCPVAHTVHHMATAFALAPPARASPWPDVFPSCRPGASALWPLRPVRCSGAPCSCTGRCGSSCRPRRSSSSASRRSMPAVTAWTPCPTIP